MVSMIAKDITLCLALVSSFYSWLCLAISIVDCIGYTRLRDEGIIVSKDDGLVMGHARVFLE